MQKNYENVQLKSNMILKTWEKYFKMLHYGINTSLFLKINNYDVLS